MPSPLALAFVSPVFGLSLQLDAATLTLPVAPLAGDLATIAALDEAQAAQAAQAVQAAQDAEAAEAVTTADAASSEATAEPDRLTLTEETQAAPEPAVVNVAEEMARRGRIARVHKWMGISTWAAMTGAVVMGTLQYANLYGFFDDLEDTRCVRGNAFFGQDACIDTPVPHLATSMLTGVLYYTTFGLSYRMPDPIGLDQGDSESARALRQHKRLRWVHFGGMALQMTLGVLVANPGIMGMDRANDFRALQALSTVHLLSGYTTYAVLTYTGARMAF